MQCLYVRYLHTTTVIVRKTWTLPKLLVSLSLNLMNLPVKYYFVLFLTAWSSKPLSVISRGLPRKHHRSQICKYCQLDNRATISPSSLLIVGFVLLSSKLRKGCALFGYGFCRVSSRKLHFYQILLQSFLNEACTCIQVLLSHGGYCISWPKILVHTFTHCLIHL